MSVVLLYQFVLLSLLACPSSPSVIFLPLSVCPGSSVSLSFQVSVHPFLCQLILSVRSVNLPSISFSFSLQYCVRLTSFISLLSRHCSLSTHRWSLLVDDCAFYNICCSQKKKILRKCQDQKCSSCLSNVKDRVF